MSEEIKIVVREERQGNALEDEQRRIAQLDQAAAAYDKKGMGDEAKSARTESMTRRQVLAPQLRAAGNAEAANAMEKEAQAMALAAGLQARMGIDAAEALAMARISLAAEEKNAATQAAKLALEKAQTAELAKQAALSKAGIHGGGYGRVRMEAVTLGRELMTGQASGRTMSSLIGNLGQAAGVMGNPAVMAAAVAAAVTVGATAFLSKQNDKDESQQNSYTARREKDTYALHHEMGAFGSAGGLAAQAESGKQEFIDRTADEKELEHKAQFKWYAPSTWSFGGLVKTDAQYALEQNQIGKGASLKKQRAAEQALPEKFKNDVGGIELDILRDTAQHSVEGLKKRLVDKGALTWVQEYKKVFNETHGNDALATEAADLTVKEQQRQQMMQAGRMINARTGAGEAAAIARLAQRSLADPVGLAARIDAFHATMKTSQGDLVESQTRHIFSR